jgi:hypothetical protein
MRQINKIISQLQTVCYAVVFLGFISACTKYEPFITDRDYIIKVVDENNQPVPEVTINIYRSDQDLRANRNAIEEFKNLKTNSKGIVDLKTIVLTTIDGFPATYYVSAEYGLKTNWDTPNAIVIKEGSFKSENDNTFTIPIKESMASFIAGRQAKRWKLMEYRVNGSPLQSCEYQTTWEFLRGTSLVNIYTRGQGCGNTGLLRGVNVWTIDDKNKTFTLNLTPNGVPTVPAARFSLLNDTKMSFSFTQVGVTVEYVYEIE